MYWEKNHANYGGAIYVDDAIPLSYCTSVATYVPKEKCFFQLKNLFRFDVQLVFKNNSATFAGTVLYGGVIDNCKLTGVHSYGSGEVFDMISLTYPDYNVASKISSDLFHLCPCVNNKPACSYKIEIFVYTVYPGETFQFSVVAVRQRNGTVPSTVRNIVETKMKVPVNFKIISISNIQTTLAPNSTTQCFHYLNMWVLNCMQKVAHVQNRRVMNISCSF